MNGNYEQQTSDQYLIPHNFKVQYSVSSEQRTMYAAISLQAGCAMPSSATPSYFCRRPGGDGTQKTENLAILFSSNTAALQARHCP